MVFRQWPSRRDRGLRYLAQAENAVALLIKRDTLAR